MNLDNNLFSPVTLSSNVTCTLTSNDVEDTEKTKDKQNGSLCSYFVEMEMNSPVEVYVKEYGLMDQDRLDPDESEDFSLLDFVEGEESEVDTIVNALTIDESNFNNENDTELTTETIDNISELSQEIQLSSDMDTTECELEMEHEADHVVMEEELVQTELGAQEIEIESETHAPEESVSDVKTKTAVPPLRPLTIAPKPEKVPITLKPVSGQQFLLVQGTSGNQQIKLLTTHGQDINLAALGRSLTLKPAVKPQVSASTLTAVQPKQVVMKKVIAPVQKNLLTKATVGGKQSHIMVVSKSEPQIKVVQSASNVAIANTKTITLQQAQELGLLTGGKVITQPSNTKHIVLNKSSAKTVKIVPQTKSPTKILPAPQLTTANKVPQRIILKPTSTSQAAMLTSGQIIQVAGTQALPAGLHQINIPGKGVQFIKFVNATSADSNVTSSSSVVNTAKTVLQTTIQNVSTNMSLKPTNVVLSEVKPPVTTNTIAPKPIKPSVSRANIQVNNTQSGQLVVLPAGYIAQQSNTKVPIPVRLTPKPATTESIPISETNLESNGIRPRKPCNCTKSQCLKLYCDCFANGEFCHMCNCMNCYNNIENEEHRQRAIKNCLERNPNAFRPKIGKSKDNSGELAVRKHTKGCNCKRSGCLKNYCECYEAKIACSSNCKCMGCRNIEDSMDKKNLRPQASPESAVFNGPAASPAKHSTSVKETSFRPRRTSNSKQAFSYITTDVIEATTQCLLALSDNAESNAQDEEVTKKQIIEEFGRCLMEIIDCSMTSTV